MIRLATIPPTTVSTAKCGFEPRVWLLFQGPSPVGLAILESCGASRTFLNHSILMKNQTFGLCTKTTRNQGSHTQIFAFLQKRTWELRPDFGGERGIRTCASNGYYPGTARDLALARTAEVGWVLGKTNFVLELEK